MQYGLSTGIKISDPEWCNDYLTTCAISEVDELLVTIFTGTVADHQKYTKGSAICTTTLQHTYISAIPHY